MFRLSGFLICILPLSIAADEKDKTQVAAVLKGARDVGQATLKGDYGKLVDLTYPKVVEEGGGRKAVIAAIEQRMAQIKSMGLVLRSIEVGEPGEIRKEGANSFVVVPTTNEITAPGGKIVGKSYLLAISSDQGRTWTYIDGTGLQSQERRDRVLPKLPADFKLPELQRPKFVKD